ncbi:MAG: hypothetical protein ACSHWY_12085 [Octadecabacter sp.]
MRVIENTPDKIVLRYHHRVFGVCMLLAGGAVVFISTRDHDTIMIWIGAFLAIMGAFALSAQAEVVGDRDAGTLGITKWRLFRPSTVTHILADIKDVTLIGHTHSIRGVHRTFYEPIMTLVSDTGEDTQSFGLWILGKRTVTRSVATLNDWLQGKRPWM